MVDYSKQNKAAWEYNAYDFWCSQKEPADRAKADVEDPVGQLKKYTEYFDHYEGLKIANICGSCGKKAIPLALLGADVTIFDISEDNKRYAMEVAKEAGTTIQYEVGDILEVDRSRFAGTFDVVFMEGGVLHYFHDIDEFMNIMKMLLKEGGRMICSDFHPFTKIMDSLGLQQETKGYFYSEVFEGEMAHARFYDDEIRKNMPKCSYRKYTISEIINSTIGADFVIDRFDEHPSWGNEKLPGEFTLIAHKV